MTSPRRKIRRLLREANRESTDQSLERWRGLLETGTGHLGDPHPAARDAIAIAARHGLMVHFTMPAGVYKLL